MLNWLGGLLAPVLIKLGDQLVMQLIGVITVWYQMRQKQHQAELDRKQTESAKTPEEIDAAANQIRTDL